VSSSAAPTAPCPQAASIAQAAQAAVPSSAAATAPCPQAASIAQAAKAAVPSSAAATAPCPEAASIAQAAQAAVPSSAAATAPSPARSAAESIGSVISVGSAAGSASAATPQTANEAEADRILKLHSQAPERHRLHAQFVRAATKNSDPENTPLEVVQAFANGTTKQRAEMFASWLCDGKSLKLIGLALRMKRTEEDRFEEVMGYRTLHQMVKSEEYGGEDQVREIINAKILLGYPHVRPHPDQPRSVELRQYWVSIKTEGTHSNQLKHSHELSVDGELGPGQAGVCLCLGLRPRSVACSTATTVY
jgi:hypothetical protein